MANIALKDTGKANILNSGTSESKIAFSGAELVLPTATMSYKIGANVDSSEEPAAFNPTTTNYVSYSNPQITISFFLNRTSSTEMGYIDDLRDMVITKGIKLLYYSSTTDGYYDITEILGYVNKDDTHKAGNFGGTATPHLHVRVIGFNITHSGTSNLLSCTLTCVQDKDVS